MKKLTNLQRSVDQKLMVSSWKAVPGGKSPSAEPRTSAHLPEKASVLRFLFQASILPSCLMSPMPVCISISPSDQLVPFRWDITIIILL